MLGAITRLLLKGGRSEQRFHAYPLNGVRFGVSGDPDPDLLMATFDHHTSRELDPQLHTHVFIFNLAPRKDGTWGAIVSRELDKAQRRAGVEYRAALARELGPRIAFVSPQFRAMSNGRSRNGGRQSRRRRRSTGIGRLKAWS